MKVAIIGNSGSGKSTLARALATDSSAEVLDLDLVFWDSGAAERPLAKRIAEVQKFCHGHESWIIEGCYADLIEASLPWRPELIFMDPGLEACISNCRRRPHEPHKYRTKEEQDQNLDFLLAWVANYYVRDGIMSYRCHEELYNCYDGPKRRVSELRDPTNSDKKAVSALRNH
jgi:adenylate kinase family enzyme